MTAAAVIYAVLTLVVVIFHLSAILGAKVGHLTMGGRWDGVLPLEGRIAAGLSGLLMIAMATVVLGTAGLLSVQISPIAIWVVVALLGLSALAHLATPSAAERRLWLPQILVMVACALAVALGR